MPIKEQERTARKQHECGRCLETIEPGTRYVVASLPPFSEGNEAPGWWRIAWHRDQDCPVLALASR